MSRRTDETSMFFLIDEHGYIRHFEILSHMDIDIQPTRLASAVLASLSTTLPTKLRLVQEIYQRNDQIGIYLCQHNITNQLTILKFVAPQIVSNTPPITTSQGCDSFYQELQVARRLYRLGGHPNVLKYENPPSRPTYLLMEYCCHGDLYSLLSQQLTQCFDEHVAIHIFSQITQGVQFLHNIVGIAHRDLSLENILLDAHWCPKICDFGLSTIASRPSSDVVGKLFYMAPEVIAGQVYNPIQADIWSLGIILFIMLTGSPLVQAAEKDNPAFSTFEKIGLMGVLHQWGLDTQLSTNTINLLTSMLQIDPLKRLSSVDAICYQLSRYFDVLDVR